MEKWITSHRAGMSSSRIYISDSVTIKITQYSIYRLDIPPKKNWMLDRVIATARYIQCVYVH